MEPPVTVLALSGHSQDLQASAPAPPADDYAGWVRSAGRVDVNPTFLTSLRVSAGACVWAVLLGRFEQDKRLCVWGVESSARRLGIAPRTGWRHNDQIERAGWLKITRRRSDSGNPEWRQANPSELVIEKTAIRSFRKILAAPGQPFALCSLAPLGTDKASMSGASFHAIRAWWIAGWMRRTGVRVTAATLAARLPTVGGRSYCSPERARVVLRELTAAGWLVWDRSKASYVEPAVSTDETQDSESGGLDMAGSPRSDLAGSPRVDMAGVGTPPTSEKNTQFSGVQSGSREAVDVQPVDACVRGASAPEPRGDGSQLPKMATGKRSRGARKPRLKDADSSTLEAALRPLTATLRSVRAHYALTLAAACMHAEQVTAGQIAWRITNSRADTLDHSEMITDPIGWLVKFGLDRRGCGNPDCENGHLFLDGTACVACREYRIDRGRTVAVAEPKDGIDGEPMATELPAAVLESQERFESGQGDAAAQDAADLRAALRRQLKANKTIRYVAPEGDER
jgi:hypothetical protein